MSETNTARTKRSPYTREQMLLRLAEVIDEVARWSPGQYIKERINDAAKSLGLSATRADDLWRGEAKMTAAEEYLNVLELYEAWVEREEKRLSDFGRTRRAQLEAWRGRHARSENTAATTAVDTAADSGGPDVHRGTLHNGVRVG